MKCVFKFPVKWNVEVERVRPFTHDGWDYEFLVKDGLISHITVGVPLASSDGLPELSRNQTGPNTIDFNLKLPESFDYLLKILRTLEGFLAVYGLEQIDLYEADVSWLAESEADKKRLNTTHFRLKLARSGRPPFRVPFSVVTRSIAALHQNLDWEFPLGFFRKGRRDFLERRYIDAIYDYYFLLETLFGNGKTRNTQVKAEFKKCPTLCSTCGQVIQEGERAIRNRGSGRRVLDVFCSEYATKTPEEYLEHVVDLRGFLHHHSSKNKRAWNPIDEAAFELDAILLGEVCFKICSAKVEGLICNPAPNQ